MKILVIQQKMIGDVLVSSLLCEHLKIHFPDSEVHYLLNEHTLAVIDGNPYIDRIIIFKNDFKKMSGQFFRFLKSIRNERYDVVIDVYGKLESNLITLFSGAPRKIAYRKWRTRIFYTDHIPIASRQKGNQSTTIDDRLGLLYPLISKELDFQKRPTIYLTKREVKEAASFLKASGIRPSCEIIMLSVLGSEPSKTYPFEYMADIIDMIAENTEATLLFNYIPSQTKDVKKLYELCKKDTRQRISLKTFAPDLRKFLGILHHCNSLIGNEGGSVNMAKALHIPTFAIFAPWIDKKGWHTCANDKNWAIHLDDFEPDRFKSLSPKEIKKQTPSLYDALKPSLFKKELINFLDLSISQKA